MSRLIDAEVLKEDLTRFYDGEVTARQLIDEQPTVEPERKRGKWIWSPVADDGTVSGCCNKCSFSHVFIGGHTAQYNYCPNCGADMRRNGGTKMSEVISFIIGLFIFLIEIIVLVDWDDWGGGI